MVLVCCVTFIGGISVVSPVVVAAISIDGPASRCGPPRNAARCGATGAVAGLKEPFRIIQRPGVIA